MKRSSFSLLLVGGLLILALTSCDISLAGDITPPPSVRAPTDVPQATAQIVLPVVPPNPAQGAALYAEKCAPCHGAAGMGNGPQAAQLPLPVPALGSADVARLAKPLSWFTTITQGRIERMMPPFKSLTDRQRWDLVAYLYTLSTPPQTLAAGKEIYETNCKTCHGISGAGDGEKAANLGTKVPNWRDFTRLAQISPKELVTVVNNGSKQVMPAYASQLTESQRWAVVDYIRTFALAGNTTSVTPAPTSPVNATPVAAATPLANSTPATPLTKLTFNGQITHSSGKTLPQGLKVTLQGFDDMSVGWEATTEVKTDGKFQFADVELKTGRVFVASVKYQNVEFASSPIHSADLGKSAQVDLPITVSESSTDASALSAQRAHIFFDFSEPGKIQVAELFVVVNPTDNAVVPVDSKTPSLVFGLPEGAENLQFQDGVLGERFVQTPNGFGDLMEVMPKGMHQVLFGYVLPYTNNKITLKIPFTLPVDSVVVMSPANGINVESSTLRSSGQRVVDDVSINMFTGSDFAKGSILDVTVSGQPEVPASTAAGTSSNQGLLIGLGVFGAVLILAGVWLFRQKKVEAVEDEDGDEEASEESEESLLDAIVALDDLFQAGKLPEAAYQSRRAELKARLKAIKEA